MVLTKMIEWIGCSCTGCFSFLYYCVISLAGLNQKGNYNACQGYILILQENDVLQQSYIDVELSN